MEPTHEPRGKRVCTCGAHFRDARELRRHMRKKAGERVVWLDSFADTRLGRSKKARH